MEDNKNIIEEKLNSEEIPASEEAAETAAQEPKAKPKDERPVVEGILDIQEENSFGFLSINRIHVKQCTETFSLVRKSGDAVDLIAGLQVKAADLHR